MAWVLATSVTVTRFIDGSMVSFIIDCGIFGESRAYKLIGMRKKVTFHSNFLLAKFVTVPRFIDGSMVSFVCYTYLMKWHIVFTSSTYSNKFFSAYS